MVTTTLQQLFSRHEAVLTPGWDDDQGKTVIDKEIVRKMLQQGVRKPRTTICLIDSDGAADANFFLRLTKGSDLFEANS